MRRVLLILIMLLGCPSLALAEEAVSLPDAQLLVNQTNPLPSYLEPQPLSSVNAFARGNSGVYLREDAAAALQAMLAGLKEAGVKDIYVNSGYRSFVRQAELYTAKVASYRRQGNDDEQAQALAARWVLPAGESEHQTGLAVDLSCSATRYDLIPSFATTAAGAWLNEHCVEYGFVVRYTEEKEPVTGVAPEPWHFRYVGVEHAAYMRGHNLCLEEYHALLREQGPLDISEDPQQQLIVRYSVGEPSANQPGTVVGLSLARKNSGEYIITTLLPPGPLYDTVDHWGEQQMRRLFELQAIAGYEDGSFRPDNTVSRAEFVTIVSRLPIWEVISHRRANAAAAEEAAEEVEEETEEQEEDSAAEQEATPAEAVQALPYIDIDDTKYYYQPLQQCYRASLVQPMMERDVEPRLFKPAQALLRREAALMMATLLEDENFVLPSSPTYTDVPPAAEALFKAVELLTARGVFRGDGLGYFYPEREITRAEICAMLTRLLDAIEAEQTAQMEPPAEPEQTAPAE